MTGAEFLLPLAGTAIQQMTSSPDRGLSPQEQMNMTYELMAKQNQYNREAVKEQEAAQLRMFSNTGYGARVEQLKKAGLNPGLIYSMGAGGGGGVTGNISAAQVSGAQAPNLAAFKANKIAEQGMMLNYAKIASEIEVNKSIAQSNRANANLTTAGSLPEKLTQIDSEKLKQIGYATENEFNKIRTEIAKASKFADIERIAALSKEAHWSMIKTMEESGSAAAKNKVDQATIDIAIEQYNANVRKTIEDIILAKSQSNVNDQRAKQIVQEIEQKWDEVRARVRDSYTRQQELDEFVMKTFREAQTKLDVEESRQISTILQTIIGAGTFGILKGGGQ